MLRKTLTILSLFGLLISVGAWGVSCYGLGVRSVQAGGPESNFSDGIHTEFFLVNGRALCARSRGMFGSESTTDWGFGLQVRLYYDDYFGGGWWRPYLSASSPHGYRVLFVSLWVPCLVFAALPAYRISPIYRRRKRKKLGLCLNCGYSLKGLTEQRCPECNTHFESHD